MPETPTTKPATILVADDEARLRRAMRGALSMQGYDILEAGNGEEALEIFWNRNPDLVLLDVNMPVVDGFEVCRQMRNASRVPIIMLTVRSYEADKVKALDFGADDYVVKPFGIDEVLARIRSALRRSSQDGNEPVIISKDLVIDFERRIIAVRGKNVHFTAKEFEVFRVLVANAGKPVSHRQLLHSVWGRGHENDVGYLRVIVNRVREKIEVDPSDPKYIFTEAFMGYRFALPRDARVRPSKPSGRARG